MGNPKGFMEVERKDAAYRPVHERIHDYNEVEMRMGYDEIARQASRCMDCGIPFCHGGGCPIHNLIPEWNDLVYRGRWKEALDLLMSSNNFPEFTGRVCPALCEAACTVGLNSEPVSIRQIELSLVERGFEEGYIKSAPPQVRTGRKVAVVGAGPAGLAAADMLNKMGHSVSVLERDNFAGGLLRYGIPDFKLDKGIVQRRIDLMAAEGVSFETGVNVGVDISARYLLNRFDAVCIAIGSREPRDINLPGRELSGIHFAMDFLWQQNCVVSSQALEAAQVTASGRKVLVIGGGDTGSDCVGTSIRQGASNVTQIEIMPSPPETRHSSTPWPYWPYQMRTSSSHKEGCKRLWSVATKAFEGDGSVKRVKAVKVEWELDSAGRPSRMKEVPGSEFTIEADLVLLAMGFTGPERDGILSQFGVDFDKRGNVVVGDSMMTSKAGVFAAGDAVSGASLVVRAMASGRKVASCLDSYLS